jgi:ElaB/YqjD/DUF883 family membrane-anchored ribosome-binding protein
MSTSTVADRVEAKAGQAKRAARDFVDEASDRASEAYVAARDVAAAVDPFVKDRPYLALGLAVLAGVIFGGLFFARGPKVIYVKPRE